MRNKGERFGGEDVRPEYREYERLGAPIPPHAAILELAVRPIWNAAVRKLNAKRAQLANSEQQIMTEVVNSDY